MLLGRVAMLPQCPGTSDKWLDVEWIDSEGSRYECARILIEVELKASKTKSLTLYTCQGYHLWFLCQTSFSH
jgi:hypothetical protein